MTKASDPLNPLEATGESALDTALNILRMGDFQMRWDIAKVITAFGERAIAPLVGLLKDEESDWELLWFVARILGTLEYPAAIAALVELLKTTDNADVAGVTATALANLGGAAVAPLADLMDNPATRLLAVQALAQIRHPDVVAPLLQTLQDASPVIRAGAIDALSHFYDPAISAALFSALRDPVSKVRQAAVVGLGAQAEHLDPLHLTQQLKPLLWDLHLEVCQQTAIALGRLRTPEATEALFEVLQSPHTSVLLQTEAVRSLSWIGTCDALNNLQQVLQSGCSLSPSDLPPKGMELNPTASTQAASSPVAMTQSSVHQEIIAVLGRVEAPEAKQRAVEILLDLLQSHHPLSQDIVGKRTIALSLGQLGQLQALDALILLLADADAGVRFHAIAALKQLDATEAYQRLQAFRQRDDLSADLQQGVAIALQEWNVS